MRCFFYTLHMYLSGCNKPPDLREIHSKKHMNKFLYHDSIRNVPSIEEEEEKKDEF